jgi:hypothetical protein
MNAGCASIVGVVLAGIADGPGREGGTPIALRRNGRSSSCTSLSMVLLATNELRTVNRLQDGGLLGVKGEGVGVEHRRRAIRQAAGWTGCCLIENELATVGWRECFVLDISARGLGISVRHHRPSELKGKGIAVEMPALSDSVSVRLEGEIRYAVAADESDVVRIGIELFGLSQEEQVITTVLSALTGVSLVSST